MAMNWPHTT